MSIRCFFACSLLFILNLSLLTLSPVTVPTLQANLFKSSFLLKIKVPACCLAAHIKGCGFWQVRTPDA